MTPAKHAPFAVPEVMNTIFHASDTSVTTELQFDNAIQVDWFDKTLFGLEGSINRSVYLHSARWSLKNTNSTPWIQLLK